MIIYYFSKFIYFLDYHIHYIRKTCYRNIGKIIRVDSSINTINKFRTISCHDVDGAMIEMVPFPSFAVFQTLQKRFFLTILTIETL